MQAAKRHGHMGLSKREHDRETLFNRKKRFLRRQTYFLFSLQWPAYLIVIFAASFFSFSLFADPLSDPQIRARRVQAHFIIKDFASAYEEARQALDLYPRCDFVHEAYIRSLAHLGWEKEMLRAWDDYRSAFPEKELPRKLIEEMAWGILNKASHSSSLIMRQMALLAAFFAQDTKGVNILFQGMRDPNYAIRAVAVKLAGHLHDAKLVNEVKRLFREEKMWLVRKEVIEAIGRMKVAELQPDLEALIASNESLAEEKALAIESLLDILDEIQRHEIVRLASSNRAGLRLLACQAIAHFQSMRDLDQLILLSSDYQPDVRTAAIQALGLLRPKEEKEIVLDLARRATKDANFKVGISAAWLLTLYAPEEGQQAFYAYLASERREVRVLAAAALAAAGKYGADYALQLLDSHSDPYVRLNLALGLVGQRLASAKAAFMIGQIMDQEKERWCEMDCGIFSSINSRSLKKGESGLSTPETDNQLIRLKLFNILAILKAPHAQESIRQFLSERSWGVSAMASALLLTEGDEAAIDLVQQLLQDPQAKVRIQAALVLSLWSHEESPIKVLEQGYQESDKETKAKILEGLGRIGSMTSVPFLIEALKEPSQTLRLIAAMALIQCLNH